MICYDLILIFYKPFIQQRLTLGDGCNVDQNIFGHKAAFFRVFHIKVSRNQH
jgi:hypothetical protein